MELPFQSCHFQTLFSRLPGSFCKFATSSDSVFSSFEKNSFLCSVCSPQKRPLFTFWGWRPLTMSNHNFLASLTIELQDQILSLNRQFTLDVLEAKWWSWIDENLNKVECEWQVIRYFSIVPRIDAFGTSQNNFAVYQCKFIDMDQPKTVLGNKLFIVPCSQPTSDPQTLYVRNDLKDLLIKYQWQMLIITAPSNLLAEGKSHWSWSGAKSNKRLPRWFGFRDLNDGKTPETG